MTASDQLARPPDAPPDGPEWKTMPNAKEWYEFSHRGFARSLDHVTNGRPFEGKVLNPRRDSDGYAIINITLADGTRKNGVSLARCILLAHAGEPDDPGMQACHGPGGQLDNRWPENLRWGTDEENRADWRRDNPPKPKPLKVCVRCGGEHDSPGRRCQPCLDDLGRQAARRIAAGDDDLDALARDLGYPSAPGLFRLAVRRGRLRCTVTPVLLLDEVNAAMRELHVGTSFTTGEGKSAHARSWLQRVMGRGSRGGDAG